MSEMDGRKATGKQRWVIIVAVLLIAILGGGYAAWRRYDDPAVERYAEVLKQIAANQLGQGNSKEVDLSASFPGLTPKNIVYLTRRPDGSFAAMFPTYYGQGVQIAGLLYTSRPLKDGDTRQRQSPIHFDETVISVGSYDALLLEKRIDPNWYHVSFRLR